ncbi:MAG: hypothetical protein WD226_05450 [Planctomycetota bacterium]
MHSDSESPDRAGRLPVLAGWAATFLGVAAVVALAWRYWGTRLQDDAYISFVYARHFALGHGLVYNVGEAPVEGYSNFLWTLGAGLAMRAGVEDPANVAQAVGVAAAALVVVLTFFLARRLAAGPLLAGLAALFVGLERTLTEEALGGLETTTFVALVVGAILLYLRTPRTAVAGLGGSALLGLATLTRPEAPLYFALLELRELVAARRRGQSIAAWLGDAVPRWTPFLALVLGHLAWRLAFYGELLPNTYHAKMTHSPLAWRTGADYVLQGLAFSGLFLVLLPFWQWKRLNASGAFLAVAALVVSLYVLQVGGDFKLSFRYLLVPIVLWGALGAAALAALARALHAAEPRLARAFAPLLFVVLSAFHVTNEWLYKVGNEAMAERHEHLVGAGKLLNEVLPAEATIAVSNAGRIPFFAQRRVIDMLGLNDHHIARVEVRATAADALVGHERGDGDYVLGRRPDAILFVSNCITPMQLANVPQWKGYVEQTAFGTSEKEIVDDPRFTRDYRIASRALPGIERTLPDGSRAPVFLNWFERTAR